MRRILLVAFAMLLVYAAPSAAAECRNLALSSNGGVASASSVYGVNFAPSLFNNGLRDRVATHTWRDGTRNVWPDWAQVEWAAPTTIDQIRLRTLLETGYTTPVRTLRRLRVQYYDDAAGTWVDVVGRSGQDNPILDWVGPVPADGSDIKQFDFAAITTTKIRVLFELGNSDGYSYIDEIEAFRRGGDCGPPATECTNLALDGDASASSVHGSGAYPVAGINNGQRESGTSMGYWNDDTNGVWPDWAQVAWTRTVTINRLTVRIPLARSGFPLGEITLRRSRIQYWDAATAVWVDVVGRSGQDNPILDWTGPIDVYDGSESRTFDFAPITTTKVRALIEDGASDGWSWLDEIEAYDADCTTTPRDVNISLIAHGGRAIGSSEASVGSIARLNDGTRTGHWLDGTLRSFPDWAGIEWRSRRPLNRIVLRGRLFLPATPVVQRTLSTTYIQYWDDDQSLWFDIVTTGPGQDNPILDWVHPTQPADGSEIKQFDFATIGTSRIRIRVDSSLDGRSFMDEIETYWIS